MFKRLRVSALAAGLVLSAVGAYAQQPASPAGNPATICGTPVPPPRALPPAGSDPVVYLLAPCFEAQGRHARAVITAEPALKGAAKRGLRVF